MNTEYAWVLEDDLRFQVLNPERSRILVTDSHRTKAVIIGLTEAGGLTFNGERLETEDFMAYVGLFDEISEILPPNGRGQGYIIRPYR